MVWPFTTTATPFASPEEGDEDDEVLGTQASLSIIWRETETMLSSMSCWPTSSRSTKKITELGTLVKITSIYIYMYIHTFLGIQFPDITRRQLFLCQLSLLLDSLLVAFCEADEFLQSVLVPLGVGPEVVHLEGFRPDVLVQVHEHVLFKARLPVLDADTVVVTVQAVDERLDRWFVQVAEVGRSLARFLAHHERLRVNETEGVDDDFAFYGLDRVHDDGNGAARQRFKGLLSVDVDGGEPAAEAWVRVVPANYGFGSFFKIKEKVEQLATFLTSIFPCSFAQCHTDPFAAASPSSSAERPDQPPRRSLRSHSAASQTHPPPAPCSRPRTRPASVPSLPWEHRLGRAVTS